jgi:hypothetical protein
MLSDQEFRAQLDLLGMARDDRRRKRDQLAGMPFKTDDSEAERDRIEREMESLERQISALITQYLEGLSCRFRGGPADLESAMEGDSEGGGLRQPLPDQSQSP